MSESFDHESLRKAAAEGRIHWRQHALERFLERGISRAAVKRAIMSGEVIEVYASDRPYPSCLILDTEREPIHVVAAIDPAAKICHVIAAYRPGQDRFEADFRTRRKKP